MQDPKHSGCTNKLNPMTCKANYNVYVEFSTLIPKSSLLNITHFSLPAMLTVAEPYLHFIYCKAWLDVVCIQFMTRFIEFYILICVFKNHVFSNSALKIYFSYQKCSNNHVREYLNSSVSLRSSIPMWFQTTLLDNSVCRTTFHKPSVHHTLKN